MIPPPSEYNAFHRYHRHVHTIGYSENMHRRNLKILPVTVASVISGYPLKAFPNLTSVVWDVRFNEHLDGVKALLTPKVRHLDLRARLDIRKQRIYYATPTDALTSVAEKAPHLTHLSLTGFFIIPPTIATFRQLGISLRFLSDLKILQPKDWHQSPNFPIQPAPAEDGPPLFPSLDSLTIHGHPAYILKSVLAIHAFPQKCLYIHLTHIPTATHIAQIFNALANHSRTNTLSHLEISTGKSIVFQTCSDRVLSGIDFRPLFRFRHLRHLELRQLSISIKLGNSDVLDMAHAWPELQFLSLNLHPSYFDSPSWIPSFPLASMYLFAAFPALQVLKIPILAPDREVVFDLIRYSFPTTSQIWGLNWDISNIDSNDEIFVIAYLQRIFPKLAMVKKCESERWNEGLGELVARGFKVVSWLSPVMIS